MAGRLDTAAVARPARPDAAVTASPATPAPAASPLPASHMLARLGHELRGPLNGIIGLTRIMQLKLSRDAADPAEQARQLEMIATSAHQLLAVAERVAEVAAVEDGPPAEVVPDCRDCVAAVLAELRPAAAARGVDLVAHLPDGPAPAAGDPGALRRLLHELVGNAVRHATTTVRLTVRPGGTGPAIEVRDDGGGIPADERAGLFTAFHRGEEGVRRDPAGTGLGLYLARRLAARCGAALELRESSPAGSTFTVHLRTGEAEPGSGAEHTPGVAADPR